MNTERSETDTGKTGAPMGAQALMALVDALAGGGIQIIDLTQTLTPEFPQIALPPEMGQCWPFRIEEVSKYDERGPGWYWNNFSCGEHTGTHFDAPIHWISGRDLPNNSVDTIPVRHFVAPACVIDCSPQVKDDPDFKKVVDSAVAGIYKSGEINKIYTKWFQSKIPPKGINMNLPMSDELKAVIKNPNDTGVGACGRMKC